MTSPGGPLTPVLSQSWAVATDALSSYTRAQAFYGSNFVPSSAEAEGEEGEEGEGEDEEDEEALDFGEVTPHEWDGVIGETIEEDEVFQPSTYTSTNYPSSFSVRDDGRVAPLRTLSDDGRTPRQVDFPRRKDYFSMPVPPQPPSQPSQAHHPSAPPPSEHSPLLAKPRAQSALGLGHPRLSPQIQRARRLSTPTTARLRAQRLSSASYTSLRRPSTGLRGVRERPSWGLLQSQAEAPIAEAPGVGTSTFGQTLFNTIAILLGIGMLSESLAFAYAGWVGGFVLLVTYGVLTCYTAKILARIMALDPKINSYADIGRAAFGPRSIWLTNSMFCLELFVLAVVLVLLFSDSMHELVPSISSDQWKLYGLLITIPTLFLPLNLLAFTSILGILSILILLFTLFYDGLSKPSYPGSIFHPAPTSLFPDWRKLPIAFGLLMSSFSGHTIIPSLARDMREPERFDVMITTAFGIATGLYAMIASAGYLMFGNAVSDEVSKDLMNTPGYNQILNVIMAVGLVINPLSKYALCTRPLSNTIESALGILPPAPRPKGAPPPPTSRFALPAWFSLHTFYLILSRVGLSLVVIAVAILVPSFSVVMSLLGSFSAFSLCVIGPICAKCVVEGRWGWVDGVVLVVATAMAVAGTVSSFV